MQGVVIEISRLVDDHFPGFVECLLIDSAGEKHVFVEKAPVVSGELSSTSTLPAAGAIACVVESEWQDHEGRALVNINTEKPWGVESSAGQTRFVVLASQLVGA